MPHSQPVLCFETLEDLNLYAYFAHSGYQLYTVNELLEKFQHKALSQAEIQAYVRTLLTEAELPKLNQFCETLEQLRLSLILNDEQVNHCFSELPLTPDNLRLKEICHAYLKTPLYTEDLCAKMWSFIGKLKTKEIAHNHEIFYFLKSKRSTFLFQELANSFSSAFGEQNVYFLEAWQFGHSPSPEIFPSSVTYDNSPAKILKSIVDLLPLNYEGQKIRIGLKCKPHALSFLEFYLKAKRIQYDSLFNENSTLRTQNLVLYPLNLLPPDPNWTDIYFVDDSFFESAKSLSLSEHSLNTLEQNGFTIPRLSTDKSYWQKGFAATSAQIFTSLAPTEAGIFFAAPHVPLERKSFQDSIETQTQVPPFPSKLTLSATALENYAHCPTKYFIENRLRLRPLATPEEEYSLILGLATHTALENYLRLEEQKIRPTLSELFEQGLTTIAPKLSISDPTHRMLRMAFRTFAKNFERMEPELKSKINFKKNTTLEYVFNFGVEGFEFSGKIDRIIETEDGNTLLLDYKTGLVDFSPGHILKGHHFQALLYVLSFDSQFQNMGLLFYDLKAGELRRGLLQEGRISDDLKSSVTRGHALNEEKWANLMETGKTHLLNLANLISLGEFKANPSSTHCSACQAKPLCRVGMRYV